MLRAWDRPSSTIGFLVFSVVCGCSFPSGRGTYGLVNTQEVGCPVSRISGGLFTACRKAGAQGQVAGCVCRSLCLYQRLTFSGLRAITKGDGMAHP